MRALVINLQVPRKGNKEEWSFHDWCLGNVWIYDLGSGWIYRRGNSVVAGEAGGEWGGRASHASKYWKDESLSVPNSPARLRKWAEHHPLSCLSQEQFSEVVETKADCSWFKQRYEIRTLGQRAKNSHENDKWRNGATEGCEAKEEIFSLWWKIVYKTCNKNSCMGQMASVLGGAFRGEQTQVNHGPRYGGCWRWVENKSHIVRDLIEFTVSGFQP